MANLSMTVSMDDADATVVVNGRTLSLAQWVATVEARLIGLGMTMEKFERQNGSLDFGGSGDAP